MTVNDILADRTIRHNLFMTRFRTHEVNEIIALFNTEILPDLLRRMQIPLEAVEAKFTDITFRRLIKEIREGSDLSLLRNKLVKDLQELSGAEAKHTIKLLSEISPIELNFVAPGARTLQALVTKSPIRGAVMDKWFNGLETKMQNTIEQQIRIGLVEGETVPELTRRIRGTAAEAFKNGTAERIRRDIEATVRTAANNVSTQAREATYKANDEVIKGVQYVATLDDRTTEICMSLDGKVFPVDEGPRPPQHFNCRSTTTPVLKSWKELGIDLKEAPPGTRASMNGQVSDKTTYGQWLKKQPNHVQEEALGIGKSKLFREGKISIDKFVDNRGRVIPLKDLEKREAG